MKVKITRFWIYIKEFFSISDYELIIFHTKNIIIIIRQLMHNPFYLCASIQFKIVPDSSTNQSPTYANHVQISDILNKIHSFLNFCLYVASICSSPWLMTSQERQEKAFLYKITLYETIIFSLISTVKRCVSTQKI